jgi:hypothetical protein
MAERFAVYRTHSTQEGMLARRQGFFQPETTGCTRRRCRSPLSQRGWQRQVQSSRSDAGKEKKRPIAKAVAKPYSQHTERRTSRFSPKTVRLYHSTDCCRKPVLRYAAAHGSSLAVISVRSFCRRGDLGQPNCTGGCYEVGLPNDMLIGCLPVGAGR